MKLYPEKLDDHLSGTLAPVYLLHGDEPLQLMEAADKLRACARQAGFDERTVFQPTDEAEWTMVLEGTQSLSLFAERRLIEVRIPTGKPGRQGAEILKQYCQAAPQDVLFLIIAGKLDRGATTSAWFKAVDKIGVTLGVFPIAVSALPRWLDVRLRSRGLSADKDALMCIVERVEGNMLAAVQEVERLALLYPEGRLSTEQVLDAVADSARYSVSDLTTAALNGHPAKALRVLDGLRDTAVAEALVIYSLSQEIRAGARVAESIDAGASMDAAMKSAGVWKNRQMPLKQAIQRHTAASWLSMLSFCARIDRLAKGQDMNSQHVDPWDALATLTTELSGKGKHFALMHSKISL